MAKNGFKVLDSDLHIVEPWDLWEERIEPEFKDRAPKCRHDYPLDLVGVVVEGTPIPRWRTDTSDKGRQQVTLQGTVDDERLESVRKPLEQNFDPPSQLEAMDNEGIDVALLYPSRGLSVMATDYQDTRLAEAVSRTYNNWLGEFCQGDRSRMYGRLHGGGPRCGRGSTGGAPHQ